MRQLSKKEVGAVLAGYALPAELLCGESLASYFSRLYMEANDELAKRDAHIAELEERLNSCLITVAKYSGPSSAQAVPSDVAFEKWWEDEQYDQKLKNVQGVMFNRVKTAAFKAWVAAIRAAPPVPFVVKLPDPYYGDRHCLDKKEVIEAIKAANGSVAE